MRTVRPAAAGDYPRIVEIENACFADPWPLERIRTEGGIDFAVIHVADDGPSRALAGWMLSWKVPGELHLHRIAVLPEWRRAGLGRALVGALVSEGPDDPILLEVEHDNAGARAFYESAGFRVDGVRRDYYGAGRDGVLMSRPGGLPWPT